MAAPAVFSLEKERHDLPLHIRGIALYRDGLTGASKGRMETSASHQGKFRILGVIWQCLKTFLIFKDLRVILTYSRWSLGILPNFLQFSEQSPHNSYLAQNVDSAEDEKAQACVVAGVQGMSPEDQGEKLLLLPTSKIPWDSQVCASRALVLEVGGKLANLFRR